MTPQDPKATYEFYVVVRSLDIPQATWQDVNGKLQ